MKKINILVAAGGTGGHLFPAISVVEALKNLPNVDCKPVFVGNENRIEGNIVPAEGYEFHHIPIRGLNRLFSLSNVTIPFRILQSISVCQNIIAKHDINVVLCTGAYISYPAGIAARLKKIPLVLMESNAIPGKSIKALSSKSEIIITAFEETINYLGIGKKNKIYTLGNPVRNTITNLPDKSESLKKFGLHSDKKTLLVFGGSLGAESINLAVKKFISNGLPDNMQIIWQTGKMFKTDIQNNHLVTILPFISDMASAYSAADLVLSRAGATTLAELAITGKPSILVPYPKAANNHQKINAELMSKHNAAYSINDNQLWDKIDYIIPELMNDSEKLAQMSSAIRKFAKPNAAENAAKMIEKNIKK